MTSYRLIVKTRSLKGNKLLFCSLALLGLLMICFNAFLGDGVLSRGLARLIARVPNKPRYLFPLHIHEQLSASKLHLVQLALLARNLDRIIVLPNVGNSRIGAIHNRPFDFYFDMNLFDENGITYIRQDDFLRQMANLNRSVTAKELYFMQASTDFDMLKNNTFVSLFNRSLVSRHQIWNHGVNIVRDPKQLEIYNDGVDVIETYFHWFSQSKVRLYPQAPLLKYSERWPNITRNFLNKFNISTAVHWRMEQSPKGNMTLCAKTLATVLDGEPVFLANDLPEHFGERSGTFNNIPKLYFDARDIVTNASSTYNYRDILKPLGIDDSGAAGIIDKLACTMIKRFIISPQECCKPGSVFTKEIIQTRQEHELIGYEEDWIFAFNDVLRAREAKEALIVGFNETLCRFNETHASTYNGTALRFNETTQFWALNGTLCGFNDTRTLVPNVTESFSGFTEALLHNETDALSGYNETQTQAYKLASIN